jgi:hypothetical protein
MNFLKTDRICSIQEVTWRQGLMAISYTIYPEQQYAHVIGTGVQTMSGRIATVDDAAEDPILNVAS